MYGNGGANRRSFSSGAMSWRAHPVLDGHEQHLHDPNKDKMFGKKGIRLLVGISILLQSVSCATTTPSETARTQSVGTAPQTAIPSLEEVRSSFDRGYEIIAGLVGANRDPRYAYVRELVSFRKAYVRWAEISGDAYRALEDGSVGGAWLVVVPRDNALNESMTAALQVNEGDDFIVLHIKQERISDQWAGLFLVHELSHLLDLLSGREPPNAPREQFLIGELRACAAELTAARLFSDGSFEAEIDLLLEKLKPASMEDLYRKLGETDAREFLPLDKALGGVNPESDVELSLRLGFYITTTCIRYAETSKSKDLLTIFDKLY